VGLPCGSLCSSDCGGSLGPGCQAVVEAVEGDGREPSSIPTRVRAQGNFGQSRTISPGLASTGSAANTFDFAAGLHAPARPPVVAGHRRVETYEQLITLLPAWSQLRFKVTRGFRAARHQRRHALSARSATCLQTDHGYLPEAPSANPKGGGYINPTNRRTGSRRGWHPVLGDMHTRSPTATPRWQWFRPVRISKSRWGWRPSSSPSPGCVNHQTWRR
jgi:hypothetical protein